MPENHERDALQQRIRELEEQLRQMSGKHRHDLNNMLMAMRGHLHMARLEIPAASELEKRIECVHEALEKAIAINNGTRGNPALSSTAPAVTAAVSKRILIVEDDPLMREMLKLTLQKAGYKTLTANNGDDALQLLHSSPRDIGLVLLDYTLPTLSGIETFTLMKNSRPALRGLLISGRFDKQIEETALKNGMAGFIPKPCNIQLLLDTVRQQIAAGPATL